MWSRKWLANFAKDLWCQIQDDNVLNGAAALAYFLLLAIFPAAIFALSLLPYLGIPHLQQALMDLLRQILPEQSASLFFGIVQSVISHKSKGLLTFGVIFTIWSASSGVYAMMQQLNLAHEARDRRPYWKVRVTAILLMLTFVALVLGSLSLAILGGAVQSWLASIIGWSLPLRMFFATFRWIIIGAALLFALALIYRFGPDAKVKFRIISPGNLTGACLIALASIGFRIYVSRFGDYDATYGSLGAMIILMLWFYLAGIAILVGGEINALFYEDEPRHLPSCPTGLASGK